MTSRGSFMHWLLALARNLLNGRARDAELGDAVNSYVELLTDEKIAAGMSPAAARRAALMEFGSVEAVKEGTRDIRAGALIAEVWQDTRYAFRIARRDLSFSAVVVLTLALGIGANTAIFSVVHGVLLKPLPYSNPDRLVLVWERNTSIGKDRDPVAPLNFLDWRQQNTVFEDVAAYRFTGFALSGVDDPEQVRALSSSSSLFRVLNVNASIGRVFTEEEQQRRDRVAVLSHEFWQRRFGGDRSAVGRSLTLNGASFTVVGIMASSFRFPDGDAVDLYTPLVFTPGELGGRRSHTLTVIGRLDGDATIESANVELSRIARSIAAQDSTSNPDVTLAGAHDVLVEDVRLGLVVLLGTVAFVLLIACANVANLLLVRAASRRREVAIRAVLGAGSRRLFRQLLTESVLLSLVGGLFGVLMAWWLLRAFVLFNPVDLPRVEHIGLDLPVLLFVTAIAAVTGITFGIVPAVHALKPGLHDATKQSSRNTTTRPEKNRGRAMLVVAEIALSMMLLAGAGLMIRTVLNVQNLDLGFQPANVLTAQIFLSQARYPIGSSQFRPSVSTSEPVPETRPSVFFTQLEDTLEVLPGIEAVGAVSALPLNPVGTDYDLPIVIEGKPPARVGEEPQADFRIATTGYFRAMRIPLRAGREFNEFDGPNSMPVAIINEALASQMFPGEDPIGHRLILYGRPREIVGVVGAVRHHGFTRGARPEMILPYRQFQFSGMTLVVRSNVDAAALASTVASAVHAIDRDQPVSRVRRMDEFLSASVAQPRFTTALLAGFAGVALTLAIIGIYGVTSYTVNQRAREIAVRITLGAHRGQVVRMVMRQGVLLAALGVAIGLAGAAAGTTLMSGLLFGVNAIDPLTFVAAATGLGLASVAATCMPAIRAARVAPVVILKSE
jgi:predicted permease